MTRTLSEGCGYALISLTRPRRPNFFKIYFLFLIFFVFSLFFVVFSAFLLGVKSSDSGSFFSNTVIRVFLGRKRARFRERKFPAIRLTCWLFS